MDIHGLDTKYWKIVLVRSKTDSKVSNYMIHNDEAVIQQQALCQQEELGPEWRYKYCQISKHTFYRETM